MSGSKGNKDVVRSIRFHAENITKASYELVTVAKDILETVQTQREIMTEQCSLVKVVAENQKDLAKIAREQSGTRPSPLPGGAPHAAMGSKC